MKGVVCTYRVPKPELSPCEYEVFQVIRDRSRACTVPTRAAKPHIQRTFRLSSIGNGGMSSPTASDAVSGSHVLKIKGYSGTKGYKGIKSEKFSIGGHLWYIDYHPNNAGWIAMFLHLDASEVKACFKLSLLDQDEKPVPSYSKVSKLCTFLGKRGSGGWGVPKFIRREDLEKSTYLKDDIFSVRFDIIVQNEDFTELIPPFSMPNSCACSIGNGGMPSQTASAIVADVVHGSHILKIEDYSVTKGQKVIKSEKFYIGGHIWYIIYYPDKADWISTFLCIDSVDANQIKARFEVSLLGKDEKLVPFFSKGSQICTFPSKSRSGGWGFDELIRREDLENSTYLKDDILSVRFDVIVQKKVFTELIPPFVLVPPPDMHRHIGSLLSVSKGTTDLTLEVGGETFAAHRCILAARSPVFMAELYGPMKEKDMSHIQIGDVEPSVFKAMLHFIYTDSLPNIEEADAVAMAQHLLVAADRFILERLRLICEEKLCNNINTSTAATTLALAWRHGCRGLKEACYSFLRSCHNLMEVMASDDFEFVTKSPPSDIEELLQHLCLTKTY